MTKSNDEKISSIEAEILKRDKRNRNNRWTLFIAFITGGGLATMSGVLSHGAAVWGAPIAITEVRAGVSNLDVRVHALESAGAIATNQNAEILSTLQEIKKAVKHQ